MEYHQPDNKKTAKRKKVGILTFHRAFNHGAMLQCYALYKTIEKLGYSAQIIDYRQPYIEKQYHYTNKHITSISEIKRVLLNPRWLPGYLINIIPSRINFLRKKRWVLYKGLSFSKKFSRPIDTPCGLDTIVIGSDQVWANYCTNGIDEMYYGNFPHDRTKVIGYAISSNIASLKETGNENLHRLCKNFERISFREEEIKDFLSKNIGLDSQIVLDPTLLLKENEWIALIKDKQFTHTNEYILTFFLNHEFNENELYENITLFAKKHNCKIINLPDVACTPVEFIAWIKNAKHIITSSFHATVFSIIFNKDFYALRTDNGKDIRYINLLQKLNIQERTINYTQLPTINCSQIDYNKAKALLEKERESSINYLRKNI